MFILVQLFLFFLVVMPVHAAGGEGIPSNILHDVPFTSQAPFANWNQPYQDACEEAAVVMAAAWARQNFARQNLGGQVQKKWTFTKKQSDREIRKLVAFQTKQYGDYKDTNAEETARFAREFYGLDVLVEYDVTSTDIRRALAGGNLVIAPMAGQLLKNPYFTPPGPAYHMLLFIGYDDDKQEFIVNDPGTRRGKHYRYSYATIDRALHDWTGSKKTIIKGRQAMIVLSGI